MKITYLFVLLLIASCDGESVNRERIKENAQDAKAWATEAADEVKDVTQKAAEEARQAAATAADKVKSWAERLKEELLSREDELRILEEQLRSRSAELAAAAKRELQEQIANLKTEVQKLRDRLQGDGDN